ncbi:MAG: GNAT family N-acetyltransferase [Deltaproteobacteria bacterium]|nr:MAG: GNAT family N-acetyltransferase [Deltaproteobacteria bacterium]
MIAWHWLTFEELGVHRLYAVLALRQAVFVVEQECAYLDADGDDADAMHLLGELDGELVAYVRAFAPGRVYDEACIGRVITAERIRGTGQGRPLMLEAIRQVEATWGPGPIKLSAQSHLRAYYESLGFAVCGEGYLEDGIPHLPMRRA